jgi:hypothetical protein
MPFATEGRLSRMLDMLDLLSNRQKSIEMDIGEAASEFAPQTGLPETIPGVGPAAARKMAGVICRMLKDNAACSGECY